METMENKSFNDQLRRRTMEMAVKVHFLLKTKRLTMLDRSMAVQVIRSASSVAANCRAMMRARSDAEFYHKLCIVTEECDETQFWFEFMVRTGLLTEEEVTGLQSEVTEEVKIFSVMKKSMKQKLGKTTG